MTDQFQSLDEFRTQRESRYFFPAIYVFVLALVVSSFVYGRSNAEHRVSLKMTEKSAQPEPQTPLEPVETEVSIEPVKSDIQVVLLLDTSSSMDGLLDQARTQLWEIVSSLQEDEKGKSKTVALGLYRYGSDHVPEENGYIQCLAPLSLDHDKVAEALKWIRAGGEKEYAGRAVLAALEEQPWDLSPAIPKVVIVVGNENFFQGQTKFDEVMNVAREKKIRILPVYCVGETASKSGLASWRRAAGIAQAELEVIDPNETVSKLETPIDQEILAKLVELRRLTQPADEEKTLDSRDLDKVLVEYRNGRGLGDSASQSPRVAKIERELQDLSDRRAEMALPTFKSRSLGASVRKGMKGVLSTY